MTPPLPPPPSQVLAAHWRLLTIVPLIVGLLALGVAFVLPPTYTARTLLLPPQPQQGVAMAALASLGALGAAGNAVAPRSPAEQFVALMRSEGALDRIVERFQLKEAYDVELEVDARRRLGERLRIAVGRKDGLITLELDDRDPQRAAAIANAFVDELRRLTGRLAVTEAQQRRLFFEQHMKAARDDLAKAQQALLTGGLDGGALRTEPRAAAETVARLQAQLTAAEVRLQSRRATLTDESSEMRQLQSTIGALRAQLAALQKPADNGADAAYISRLREFKYQESLFEMFARQYELARVEESREGGLIQVIDEARPPQRRSGPRRGLIAVGATVASFAALALLLLSRERRRLARSGP